MVLLKGIQETHPRWEKGCGHEQAMEHGGSLFCVLLQEAGLTKSSRSQSLMWACELETKVLSHALLVYGHSRSSRCLHMLHCTSPACKKYSANFKTWGFPEQEPLKITTPQPSPGSPHVNSPDMLHWSFLRLRGSHQVSTKTATISQSLCKCRM